MICAFFDTETSGLNKNKDYLLQFTMVKFVIEKENNQYIVNDKDIQIFDQYNDIPQHLQQDIREELFQTAFQHNKLNKEMIQNKQLNIQELKEFMQGVQYIFCHNLSFDYGFFMKIPLIKQINIDNIQWFCTLNQINWIERKYESKKLEYLCQQFNYQYNSHNAVDDCLAGIFLLKQSDFLQYIFQNNSLQLNIHLIQQKSDQEMYQYLKKLGFKYQNHKQRYGIKNSLYLSHELNKKKEKKLQKIYEMLISKIYLEFGIYIEIDQKHGILTKQQWKQLQFEHKQLIQDVKEFFIGKNIKCFLTITEKEKEKESQFLQDALQIE